MISSACRALAKKKPEQSCYVLLQAIPVALPAAGRKMIAVAHSGKSNVLRFLPESDLADCRRKAESCGVFCGFECCERRHHGFLLLMLLVCVCATGYV